MEMMDMRAAAQALDNYSGMINSMRANVEKLIGIEISDPEIRTHFESMGASFTKLVGNSCRALIAIVENSPALPHLIHFVDDYVELSAAQQRYLKAINEAEPIMLKLKPVSAATPASSAEPEQKKEYSLGLSICTLFFPGLFVSAKLALGTRPAPERMPFESSTCRLAICARSHCPTLTVC